MNHIPLSITDIADFVSAALRFLGVSVLVIAVARALAYRAGYRLVRGNCCFDIKANAK